MTTWKNFGVYQYERNEKNKFTGWVRYADERDDGKEWHYTGKTRKRSTK